MSAILAYHPGTRAQLVVDDEQLLHMRVSGWMTQAEWDANQAAASGGNDGAAGPAVVPAAADPARQAPRLGARWGHRLTPAASRRLRRRLEVVGIAHRFEPGGGLAGGAGL